MKARTWTCPHLIWKWSTGPGLLCSSGCCSQIVSTMGTLLHGDRIPERNRSNFKRQENYYHIFVYVLSNILYFFNISNIIGHSKFSLQLWHIFRRSLDISELLTRHAPGQGQYGWQGQRRQCTGDPRREGWWLLTGLEHRACKFAWLASERFLRGLWWIRRGLGRP